MGPGLGRDPRCPLSYANPLRGRRSQPSICFNKTCFFMLFKKGVGPVSSGQSQRQGAGGVVNFLIMPKPKLGSKCPKLGVQRAGPSIIPSPFGGGRSVAAGGGARSGRTCSAPGSSVRLRCPRCRRPPRLRDAQGAQHPLWPPREHPGVPPPTCHDPPEALHQPDGRSHGAPGFHPLVHQEDAQTWGGAEAASERPVPCAGSPPRGGSAPWAHPARRCRCGPPSPSPGLSSRCRAPTASPRRGAQLYGWPGSPCAARWPRQHLGVAAALSAPRGDKVWGPRARPHPPSPRMKPMASMPATRSMGSPWKGCSRSATQSCKAWGDSGGAGCP